MASLLNTTAPFLSELSMIFQLVALGLLIVSFVVIKQKKYTTHGSVMFISFLLNVVSVLAVMVPIALRLASISFPGVNLLFRVHGLLGIIVICISGYILADWRFQKPGPTCFQRRKWMLGLGLTWIFQVILGIILFLRLYPL